MKLSTTNVGNHVKNLFCNNIIIELELESEKKLLFPVLAAEEDFLGGQQGRHLSPPARIKLKGTVSRILR